MPRRRDDSERPGLCSIVRASRSSKLSKLAGPLMKLVIGAAFSAFTPGVTSTSTSARTSSGAWAASARDDTPPRDMPTTPRASGASSAMTVARSRPLLRAEMEPSGPPSEWPCPGRSIARSGRPSARATVSQVWAFCAPPCTSTISGGPLPQTRLDTAPAGRDLDVDAPHLRWPVVGEAVLGGVLMEQPELVVGLQFRHAHECPIRTPGVQAG